MLAIGVAALLLVTLALPHYQTPIPAGIFFLALDGLVVAFGLASYIRHEGGAVALLGRVVAALAVLLLVVGLAVPFVFGVILRAVMSD